MQDGQLIAYENKKLDCCAPLQKGCPKHHGHTEDPEVTPRIYGTNCDKGPSNPNMGEGFGRWERLPPT
jgi:hypothetical protein